MKVIIAGSRTIDDYPLLCDVVEASKFNITEVVSGGAIGVDKLGERWARDNSVAVKIFKPDYVYYPPKFAPLARNQQMAEYADALILLWDGKSKGSYDMLQKAIINNLTKYISD